MAKNCQSCQDLMNDAPSLIVNGLGTTEITSLRNNTGLSPSNGNDDCTDLNNMNDCLIGNMEDEIDSYDVCDWKPFTKNFVGNAWTMFGGIIAAICGIWTNIKSLKELLESMCEMMEFRISPRIPVYGIAPRRSGWDRGMGSIPKKNGRPALIDAQISGADDDTMVGIRYMSLEARNCSGGSKYRQEFWRPYVWGYNLNKDLEIGDAVFVVTKSQLQSKTEWSDALWNSYTRESWTWSEGYIANGSDEHKRVYFKLHVGDAGYSNDYLVMTFQGTSYPNAAPNYDALVFDAGFQDYRTRKTSN